MAWNWVCGTPHHKVFSWKRNGLIPVLKLQLRCFVSDFYFASPSLWKINLLICVTQNGFSDPKGLTVWNHVLDDKPDLYEMLKNCNNTGRVWIADLVIWCIRGGGWEPSQGRGDVGQQASSAHSVPRFVVCVVFSCCVRRDCSHCAPPACESLMGRPRRGPT